MPDRLLHNIAYEIAAEWPGYARTAARDYVAAMSHLDRISDPYVLETASSVVARFLANCGTWRGPAAKRVKSELRGMLERHEAVVSRRSVADRPALEPQASEPLGAGRATTPS